MIYRKYQGVEQLIFRGFLTSKLEHSGITFVLKSINTKELETIKELTPLKSNTRYNQIFESLIISFSIYLFDGDNSLLKRPHNIKNISESILQLPLSIRSEMMEHILVLQKAQDFELHKLESFSYEPESRQLWKSYSGKILNDPTLTSIPGTDKLGLNSHQIAWAYLNSEEDLRLAAEEQWSYSKFIASAINPKGVKSIGQKDKARINALMEEREKIRQGLEYRGPERIERRSVEDLRQQLQLDLEGKQDLHDKIIATYEASIQDRNRQRMQEQVERLADMKSRRDSDLDNMTDEEIVKRYSESEGFITVFTKEQIEEMRKQQSQESINWSKKQIDGRYQSAKQYMEDRREISSHLRDLVGSDEVEVINTPPQKLVIPTDETGPRSETYVPTQVSTKASKNSRLPVSNYIPPTPKEQHYTSDGIGS